MRRRWPLTPRGSGALVLAIACFALAGELGTVELLYVGCLLLAVLLAGMIALRLGSRLDRAVRSLHPDVVPVGQSVHVRIDTTLRAAMPVTAARWSDRLPAAVSGESKGALELTAARTGPGRESVVRYEATTQRRGIHSLGPFAVQISDPFGLTRRSHTGGEPTRLIAVPATIPLPAIPLSVSESGGVQQSASDRLGQGTDNLIARPYAPGDSMRRIHWRATAHRDQLMVRQEEQDSTPAATVLIDLSARRWDAAARSAPGEAEAFEAALSACVSIVLRLAHDGCVVHVCDSDGRPLCEPVPGADAAAEIEAMLVRFATLTTRRDDTLTGVASLFTGDTTGPVAVITGYLDDADAVALAPAAHHSTLPVLLSAHPQAGALDRARDAGWHTAAIGPDTDLAEVWTGLADHGNRHVMV